MTHLKPKSKKLSLSFVPFLFSLAVSTNTIASPQYEPEKDLKLLIEKAENKRSSFEFPLASSGIDGWAITFDNDVLVPTSRDQDYTYGISLTLIGDGTRESFMSSHGLLDSINSSLGFSRSSNRRNTSEIEFGIYGFTPEEIAAENPLDGDRPYASLIYSTSTQEISTQDPNVSWRTSLTFGVLGSDIVGRLQNDVHSAIGGDEVNGWKNQISEGGELTARYSVARQELWPSFSENLEVKTTAQASVGYLTEMSYSISARYGDINSRWQSFSPELAAYGEHVNQSVDSTFSSENYWMFGASLKLRAYNAFMQGQFRESSITYSRNDLNSVIAEAWVGYNVSFGEGYRLTYLLRGHTSEMKRGVGDRNVVWGGLTLSKEF